MSVRCAVEAGVGRILLNRPDRMNAIDVALAAELGRAVTALGQDPAVNVILIQGAGGNFCAGGDFHEVERLREEGAEALAGLFITFRAACDAIAAAPVPVIAAVEGVAAAGGFELMQAADIVLVSDNAKIADSHVKFGMVPGGGSSVRLPRLVGVQRAMGLLLSGDRIGGAEAVALGLAYRNYPESEYPLSVTEFVSRLANRDRATVSTIKRLVRGNAGRPLADALDVEIATVVRHIMGAAGADGVEQFVNRQDRGVRT